MKTNIGKNTLGDNNKMSVTLREYGRSTHDLSYAWRSSMGIGTLVPFMKILGMPGDTFSINLETKIMTHPTIGPLFGSFKFQADVFTCPIRLYNAMLHNNALNIGMDMGKVKLPKLESDIDFNTNASNVFNYLGIKKFKNGKKYNAVPWLGYIDIFKNYYANKQEDICYTITNGVDEINLGFISNEQPAILAQNITTPNQFKVIDDTTWKINTEVKPDEILTSDSYVEGVISKTTGPNESVGNGVRVRLDNTELSHSGKYLEITIKGETILELSSGSMPSEDATITVDAASLYLKVNSATELSDMKLEDIDSLREEILGKGRQEYIIGGTNNNCNVNSIKNIFNNARGKGALSGLFLKTHMSDIFNNWINKEWIDGDNGIAAITAIDTSGGSFTIDTLNLAEKVYTLLNRIAISGGSYKDWIETVYTTDYYFRAETPVYEGGMSTEIEFSEVVSTAATEITGNEPLGSLGGKGYTSGKKGGTITIKVNEPCYIIGVASITPRVDYSQGNEWDCDLDTLNDMHKPQLDGIGYQDLMEKWMHADAGENVAIGKTIAWINYMTNYNKTFGSFAVGGSESYMVLNRMYEVERESVKNATTYINPKEFTGTFATNTLSNMDFWVQIGCGINARRVMSAKQIPIM